jgi:hypothetical protein
MSVTGHYIDAPKTSPRDWELRSAQLGLPKVVGHHTGKNLARILVQVVDRYGFRDKVGCLHTAQAVRSDFICSGWLDHC